MLDEVGQFVIYLYSMIFISSDDGLIVSVTVPDVVRLYDWDTRLITLIPLSDAEKQEELIMINRRYRLSTLFIKIHETAISIGILGDNKECFCQLE